MFYGQVEGTDFVVLDKRFSRLFAGHIRVDRLWTGAVWSEGPAWFAAGRYLIWSDIPNNRMLRYDEASGHVSVFRQPSMNSNGNTVDNQGRLVTCEHLMRRVTRTEIDGSITVLADKWQGKRLNSPNDVVGQSTIRSGSPTRPTASTATTTGPGAAGDRRLQRLRIDPKSREVARVIGDMVRPNGIAFSPDEKMLYVAEPARPISRRGRATSASSAFRPTAEASRAAKYSLLDRRTVRRLSRRRRRAGLGEHGRGRPLFRTRRNADRQDPDPRDRRHGSRRHSAIAFSSAARPRSTLRCL